MTTTDSLSRSVSFGQNQQVEFDNTMASNQIGVKLQAWLAPILTCGGTAAESVEMHLCGEETREEESLPLKKQSLADDRRGLEITLENVLEYEELKKNRMLPESQLERDFYKSADALCKIQHQQQKDNDIKNYETQIAALKEYLERPKKVNAPNEKQALIEEKMKKTIAMVNSIAEQQEQLEQEFVSAQKEATTKKSYFSIVQKDTAEDLGLPPPLKCKMRIAESEHELAETARNASSYKTPEYYLNDDVADASEEPVQCLERPKLGKRPPTNTLMTRMRTAVFGEGVATPKPTSTTSKAHPEAMDGALKKAWGEIIELAADLKFSLVEDDDETASKPNPAKPASAKEENSPSPEVRDSAPVETDDAASKDAADAKEVLASKTKGLGASVKNAAKSLLRKPSTDTSIASRLSRSKAKDSASVKSTAAASIKDDVSVVPNVKNDASSIRSIAVAPKDDDISVISTSTSVKGGVASAKSSSKKSSGSVKSSSMSIKGDTSVKSAVASMKGDASVKSLASVKSAAASVKGDASVKSAVASLKGDASVKSLVKSMQEDSSVKSAMVSVTGDASIKSAAASVKGDTSIKSAVASMNGDASIKSAVVSVNGAASIKSAVASVNGDASVKSTAASAKGDASAKSTVASAQGDASVKSTAASVKGDASVKSTAASVKGDASAPGESSIKSEAKSMQGTGSKTPAADGLNGSTRDGAPTIGSYASAARSSAGTTSGRVSKQSFSSSIRSFIKMRGRPMGIKKGKPSGGSRKSDGSASTVKSSESLDKATSSVVKDATVTTE